MAKYPENSTYLYHLGAALMAKGESDEGRHLLESALDGATGREKESIEAALAKNPG